jgi:hypothetical protein
VENDYRITTCRVTNFENDDTVLTFYIEDNHVSRTLYQSTSPADVMAVYEMLKQGLITVDDVY